MIASKPPAKIPPILTRSELRYNWGVPEIWLSGGPKIPPEALWPGLGAPPAPFPPPSTFDGAVGKGPVDVGVVELEAELVTLPVAVELPVNEAGVLLAGAAVMATD